jgi:hypothetical protein
MHRGRRDHEQADETHGGQSLVRTPEAFHRRDEPPAPKRATEVAGELVAIGRAFDLYDTAKVTNIHLQANGYSEHQFDHDNLLHVGRISQYRSHPRGENGPATTNDRPRFAASPSGARRWDFARWAAETLTSLVGGGAMPALPSVDHERAARVQGALRELVEVEPPG